MYIKNIILLFAFIISANAEIVNEKNYYNALCIADKSVGFSWEHSNWKKTNFYTSKYIVQKVKIENPYKHKNTKSSASCFIDIKDMPKPKWYKVKGKEKKWEYGCYNIRQTGDKFYNHTSELCTEVWKKDYNGKQYLESIDCKYFKFRPNGWFHQVSINDNTENNPKKDYKDSLSISIGKCSTL